MNLVQRCLIKTLQQGFVLGCCTLFTERNGPRKDHKFSFVAFKERCKENSFLCPCYGVRDVSLLCCKSFFLLTSTFYFYLDKSLDFSKKNSPHLPTCFSLTRCLFMSYSHSLQLHLSPTLGPTHTHTQHTCTHFFLYFSHWLSLLHRWQVFSGCVQFSQPAVIMHNSLRYKTQAS